MSGNRGRMKFGMRSSMHGRVTKILHILMMSCSRYLRVVHLTTQSMHKTELSILRTRNFNGSRNNIILITNLVVQTPEIREAQLCYTKNSQTENSQRKIHFIF